MEQQSETSKGLGLDATREEDFSGWYQQVITRSEMIEYYDISGCYILRPWSYAIWEQIQAFFDGHIKKLGVENAYFPLFVSNKALTTEKDHIEGFAPEVAWVTRAGSSELAEPIAVRPTSETIMYPAYAKWIRSHRDLPLRLNQWANVVRWEFKRPVPFLRSREFLWQEGHTVHATKEGALEEVHQILDLYRQVFEDLLAVPVIKGAKSESEKFAGGLYTTTVEAFIAATGKGIQGATSHCLGQNFSKMFGIEFEGEDGKKAYAWQNSWGLTTRSIGVLIMIHGDNKGLVLPPRIAPIQVVLVPIILTEHGEEGKALLLQKAEELMQSLREDGVRGKVDDRLNYSPGWKYNHWELKGVPIRLELGPTDLKNEQAIVVRRDSGQKEAVKWEKLVEHISSLITEIQKAMLLKATKERDSHFAKVTDWSAFIKALIAKHLVMAPWCDTSACEKEVKERSANELSSLSGEASAGAKTLCIPFQQESLPAESKCFACGQGARVWALWGQTY